MVSGGLVLRGGARGPVGAERIALLEAIGRAGSIAGAAKAVGLSYKGAWDAVQALNNLFERPLVVSQAGGKAGGFAEVTEEGVALISAFKAMEAELAQAIGGFERRLERFAADRRSASLETAQIQNAGARSDAKAVPTFAERAPAGDRTQPLRTLLWSLGMKTSARNAMRGVVDRVVDGAVNAEVILKIGGGAEIVAVVTRHSVEDLGLKPGASAIALIKSSFVILARDAESLRTSARNKLTGTVARVERGAVNDEVTLDLGAGKTITATVTHESAGALDLRPGERVTALIKASHVILAVE